MPIRQKFAGMLPEAIEKFEELLAAVEASNPQVIKGYDPSVGQGSFFYWGAACQVQCADMEQLRTAAEGMGIIWLSDDGEMAYANGLTIEDFQTYRVNGDLELAPEREV